MIATNVTAGAEPLAVSFEEAARLLPLSIYTLRLYERKGLLKSVRVGRRVLIPMSEIKRIVAEGMKDDVDEKSSQ